MSILSRFFNGHDKSADAAVIARGHGRPSMDGRDQEICRRYSAGENTPALADEYGISRERICQILRRGNLIEGRRERRNLAREAMAAAASASREEVQKLIHQGVELVRGGVSIRQAQKQLNLPAGSLEAACHLAGVKTRYGRWRSFDDRKRRVRELAEAGHCKTEIIRLLRSEGEKIHDIWITNHCQDINFPRGSRAPRHPKRASPPPASIWTAEKVADLKRYWLQGLSAAHISDLFGEPFTRNSIIGKVNRLRAEGQLHI